MKSYNFNKLNEPIISRNLIVLVFVLYIFWLFKTYNGNHHTVYLHMWKFVFGTYSFENDFWLQRTHHHKVSIMYHLFKYLKINPDNDYIGFLIHILFSTISGFFLFKIIKNFTSIKETNGSLIIIFSLLMIGSILVYGNFASWIIRFQAAPSYFGHQLIFVFIWLLLVRKPFWLFIISSLMLLIMVKATWFTVGVGMLYSVLFIKPFKKNFWIIGPIIALGYLSSQSINTDYDTNLLLFNSLIERDVEEVAFHLQQKNHLPNFIALIISFPIYFLMLKKFEENSFKKLAQTLFISSILCFVFGYIYALYGDRIWPEPRLLALSATRALGLYQLFFWILLSLTIYKLNIYQIYKVALLSSLFYTLTLSTDSFLFSLLILLFSFLIIKFYKHNNFLSLKNLILNKSLKFSYFSTLLFFLMLAPGIVYLFANHFKHVDFYALKKINKWTMGLMEHDNDRLDTAIMLQKCDDFNLLDLKTDSKGNLIYYETIGAVAGKSTYYGGVNWNYFDLKTHRMSKFRLNIVQNINKNIQKKIQIDNREKDELLKTGVVVIIDDDKKQFFPNDITTIDLKNSNTLLLFLNINKKDSFIKNCKQFLKV